MSTNRRSQSSGGGGGEYNGGRGGILEEDRQSQTDYVYELFNLVVVLSLIAISVVSMFAPLIHPNCTVELSPTPTNWNNPSYEGPKACRFERHVSLLGLNLQECDFGSRLVVAAFLGAIIGFERRTADRPAGIRTMSLASIGAAAFTVCSGYGFKGSPMIWDSSRISAAIPSGVGFLGAGIIWKGLISKKSKSGQQLHEVRGLTTAASVWLSAAVGLAVGGNLYAVGILTTMLTIVILRFGPRFLSSSGSDDMEDLSGDEDERAHRLEEDRAKKNLDDSKEASRVLRYIRRAQNHANLNPYV